MILQKILKKVINNNDYFKLKKINTDRNASNKYLPNLTNNLTHRNLSQDNIKNNIFEIPALSNNISAYNNIAKYKEKIINRQKVVDQNYKNFNIYKNNLFKKIHLRNNQNFDFNNNNNNFISLNNEQKNGIKREGNRIYKSESAGNIFKNYFYLSEQLDNFNNVNDINNIYNKFNTNKFQNKKNINNYYKRYFDKRRTDITDNSLLQIKNDKQGFVDYYNKVVEIQNENIKISEAKKNLKEINMNKSRLNELNNIYLENNYFNKLATQDFLGKKNSKLKYKLLLDEQVKHNLNDKLMNENISYNDLIKNKKNIPQKDKINDRTFLNLNKFVEINPYKQRNYHLGNSFLKRDVINNPQSLFKLNKYFFPKNDLNEINY